MVSAILASAAWANALAQPPAVKEVSGSVWLKVESMPAATAKLRALVTRHGGELERENEEAALDATVRLPPESARDFLAAAAQLGEVENRSYAVADGRLNRAQLAAQRARLEQDLKRVSKETEDEPGERAEVLRAQLRELETEELASADRATRATVSVRLRPREPAPVTPVYSGDVRFYPGARFSHLLDAGGAGTKSLLGVGLVVKPVRWFDFEAELFRDLNALGGRPGADAGLFTVGAEASSELLGDGRRRFFNPHLGLRLGLASSFGRVDLALGVSGGVELLRLDGLSLDAQVRLLGLVGNHAGPLLLVQSGLAVVFSY